MQSKVIALRDVLIDVEFDSCEDALGFLANKLVESGVCKPDFVEAILKRESEFPTGLETESGIGVALPHADAQYVNDDSVLVAILSKELDFCSMAFPEQNVDVKVVIMLAISEPDGHLEILQKLSDLLCDSKLLKEVAHSKDKLFVSKVFRELFA